MNTVTDPHILELQDIEPQPAANLPAVQSAGPAALMLQAMQQGASLEQIEKMMDLQERWEKREAEKAFRDDFAGFRGENIIVPKTKHVDRGGGGSFDQAEYHVAANLLSPALSRHGFSFRHDQKFGHRRVMTEGVENDIGWVWVTCHLEHRKGHAERLELEGPPGEMKVNTPTQNMQLTASYLKRQSLLAITGTATGGEDDEARMRKKGAGGDDGQVDEALQAGRDAAMQGMDALTAWWGKLAPKDRTRLTKEFGNLRKVAGRG